MDAIHHHHWRVRSSHVTSEGFLDYEGCLCGAWRVSLKPTTESRSVLIDGLQERQTGATSRR